MKKLLLLLTLLLALSGCGQKPPAPDAQPPARPASDAQASATPDTPAAPADTQAAVSAGDRNPTAAELGREERKDLVFLLEGTEERVPATLYIAQGYSLYIPDEGWRLETDTEDGIPEDKWESTVSDDVSLRVLHLGEMTPEQAQAWVMAEEDDYALIADQQGGLGGTDTEDKEELAVRFYPSGSQMYAVMYEYPSEAAEGFGVRLSVLADTFAVME